QGASASVSANLTVNPVNDAPLLTGLMAKLGLGKEDHSFTIKASDLLAGFNDPDGDDLSVANLRVADGQGTLSAGDAGTWTFTPDANWNGTVALEYQVTDGQLVWQSEGGSQGGSTIEHADFEGNGWSLTGDGAAFVSSADGWQSPTQQIELKNNLDQQGTAASGEQFIELNEDPIDFFPDSPSIFKEIETVAGQSYDFSLQYAGRPGFDESVNRFEVLIDGVSQGTWSQNNSGSDHLWETLNLSFDASSSSTRIEIREAGDDEAFGRGMRIDDIRISTQGSGAATNTVRQTFEIAPVNDTPELTGAKAVLADGTEDVAYTINAADLLQGYTDVDGDTLSVKDLTASVGDLANNNDGTWTLTAPQDFNGKVDLSYSVSDGNGASTAGSHSFSLTPVNDAPVVSGAVNLGEMLEDGTFRITSEQLLANASDVDGDSLSVVDLKLASGQGSITDNGDGSWSFSPDANWHGDVSFSYGVSDGQTTTPSNQRDDLAIRGNSLYVIVDGPSWTEA
ncbi:tandem-95 repeat protein, partial [bacterium]|nr:tandem-95 repeat protein [bacterium]